LQSQNSELAKFARSEQLAAEAMRNEVIQHITKLMDKYVDARGNTLRETTNRLATNISEAQREIQEFKFKHGSGVGSCLAEDAELLGQVQKTAKDCRRAKEIVTQTLDKLPPGVGNATQQTRTQITLAAEEYSRTLRNDAETLGAAASGTFERLEKSRLLRLEELTALRDDSIRSHQNTKRSASFTSNTFRDAERDITEVVSTET
jgi:hypothetical protein